MELEWDEKKRFKNIEKHGLILLALRLFSKIHIFGRWPIPRMESSAYWLSVC